MAGRVAGMRMRFKSLAILLGASVAMATLSSRAETTEYLLDGRFLSGHDPGWMKVQLMMNTIDLKGRFEPRKVLEGCYK